MAGVRLRPRPVHIPPAASAPVVAEPTVEPVEASHADPGVLVRPYLLDWERRRERLRQRERRTALLLATCGIDYLGVAA